MTSSIAVWDSCSFSSAILLYSDTCLISEAIRNIDLFQQKSFHRSNNSKHEIVNSYHVHLPITTTLSMIIKICQKVATRATTCPSDICIRTRKSIHINIIAYIICHQYLYLQRPNSAIICTWAYILYNHKVPGNNIQAGREETTVLSNLIEHIQ